MPYIDRIERAKKPKRLPVVYSRAEAKAILANLEGTTYLIVGLLYGCGLRLTECLSYGIYVTSTLILGSSIVAMYQEYSS